MAAMTLIMMKILLVINVCHGNYDDAYQKNYHDNFNVHGINNNNDDQNHNYFNKCLIMMNMRMMIIVILKEGGTNINPPQCL